MKKTQRIRQEIAKLQEDLKAAETRDAERIGRIALKAGLGNYEIEDSILQSAFEEIAGTFHSLNVEGRRQEQKGLTRAPGPDTKPQARSSPGSNTGSNASPGTSPPSAGTSTPIPTGTAQGKSGEA
jgi:hypothetical protein